MRLIQFIRNNWSIIKEVILSLLILLVFWAVYIGVKRVNKSFIFAEPSEIVVIRPTESQEVIVIGDPDKVTVNNKRNNRK